MLQCSRSVAVQPTVRPLSTRKWRERRQPPAGGRAASIYSTRWYWSFHHIFIAAGLPSLRLWRLPAISHIRNTAAK